MGDPLKDPRFSHLSWDPKFSRVPRKERKVKIDDRFKSMFTDSKFKERYSVDKRGKKINRKADQDLKRYYDLSSSESDEDVDEQVVVKLKKKPAKKKVDDTKIVLENEEKTSSDDEEKSSNDSGNESEHSDNGKINLDLARGQGNLSSSSSDEEGGSDYTLDGDEEIPEHKWGELDADAPRVNDITYRLAVCNMDWDRVKAKDLLVLFNSFKPPTGNIESVKIYPSKFGKERMAEEETRGPKELRELDEIGASNFNKKDDEDDDPRENGEEDDEEDRLKILQREKIRQYQLNRLKYYYAVIECDSAETANGIYEACDGVEYESSATKIDLRFVPDDTTFDEDAPSDEATDLGDLNAYKPLHFRNAALQQSKVELTWDETSDARKELVKSMFENQDSLDKLNLKGILASGSSEDEEEDEENNAGKLSLKSLVEDLLQKKDEKLREKEDSFFVRSDDGEKNIETKQEKTKKSSSWQRYLEKRREKRQQQRQEDKEKIDKSKKLNCSVKNTDLVDDLPAGIDMNDPYFKEEMDKFDNPTELPDEEEDQQIEDEDDNSELKNQQLELLLMSSEKSRSKNYNLKKLLKENEKTSGKRSKKRKMEQISEEKPKNDESDFKINANDPRFSALYTSHLYNIDPTEPSYKKTKNMQSLVDEKLKRIVKNEHKTDVNADKELKPIEQITDSKSAHKNEAAELNLLVKKVKSKANIINNRKKNEKLAKS